jgi:hypothetical protein
MERLLAEMELVPHVEGCLDDFMQRFFALLRRRDEIARKALAIARMDVSPARTATASGA